MIRNKIIALIILVLMVLAFTTGCSDKADDKAEINAEQNIADKELDTDVPEDVEDDEDEDEDKDHVGYEIGEEWPTELMDGIPQPPGRVTTANSALGMRHIEMEKVKKKDAQKLLDDLKSLGFVEDPQEMIRDTYLLYIGKHEDGRSVSYKWDDDKKMVLIYESNE